MQQVSEDFVWTESQWCAVGNCLAVIAFQSWADQTGPQCDCFSSSLLIQQLTELLLFTVEGSPARLIQKTQIPLLVLFSLCFSFSTEAHTNAHTHTFPFPANRPPPSCYLAAIRQDFWRAAAANRNFLCQIVRVPRSEKGLILWWAPSQNRGA